MRKPNLCKKLIDMGAVIQINADSVLGLDGIFKKQFCKKLLKYQLVNIIASNAHGCKERASHMSQCYEYVQKKYDKDYAEQLFYNNPNELIASGQ
jgi:protein-tyrosine phosphatase